jgi:hypothetical protein
VQADFVSKICLSCHLSDHGVKGQGHRTGILDTMIYENFSMKRTISKTISSISECSVEKWLVLKL